MRLAAYREFFDRLIGKPQVTIDTALAKLDVGAMYRQALQRANSHAVPRLTVIDGDDDNSNAGAASDPTEIQ
jgi:hypothetical protein